MANTNSNIEEKKKSLNKNKNSNSNDWGKFGMSIISNLVTTIAVGLIGSNFIYMTTANTVILDKLLPTEESDYFVPDKDKDKEKIKTSVGGGKKEDELKNIGHNTNWKLLKKFGIGTKGGGVYKMYNKENSGFGNWIARSTADSYIRSRSILKSFLAFFSPSMNDADDADDEEEADTTDSNNSNNMFSNQSFQMLFVAPTVLLLSIFIFMFIGISTLYSTFKLGWIRALIGIFFVYTYFVTAGVATVQSIQFICTLLFVPLLADWGRVKHILTSNVDTLSFLFGILVCTSASKYLNQTISITMFVMYAILLIKYIFF